MLVLWQVATRTSLPGTVSDTTTEMHNILPIFPHLQWCRHTSGRVVSRGPTKRGNGARIKEDIKANCFLTHLLCPQSCRSSNQLLTGRKQWMQSRRVGPLPRTPARGFLCKKHPTAFNSWSQTSFQRVDHSDVYKTYFLIMISIVYNPFLLCTRVCAIYTHLSTVGHYMMFQSIIHHPFLGPQTISSVSQMVFLTPCAFKKKKKSYLWK